MRKTTKNTMAPMRTMDTTSTIMAILLLCMTAGCSSKSEGDGMSTYATVMCIIFSIAVIGFGIWVVRRIQQYYHFKWKIPYWPISTWVKIVAALVGAILLVWILATSESSGAESDTPEEDRSGERFNLSRSPLYVRLKEGQSIEHSHIEGARCDSIGREIDGVMVYTHVDSSDRTSMLNLESWVFGYKGCPAHNPKKLGVRVIRLK